MEAIGLLHGVVPVLFTTRTGRVGSIMEAERIRVLLWEGRRSGARRIPVDMQQSPCSPKASPRQLYHSYGPRVLPCMVVGGGCRLWKACAGNGAGDKLRRGCR